MEKIIKVEGMNCQHCSGRVEQVLNELSGVVKASVSLADNNANVEYDESKISLEEIYQAIDDTGYISVK